MLCFAATNVKRAAHESVVFLAPVRQIGLTTADLAVAFKLRHYGASAGLHWYRLITSDILSGADCGGYLFGNDGQPLRFAVSRLRTRRLSQPAAGTHGGRGASLSRPAGN